MAPPLRLLALLSGGKDSVYAALCARAAGHTLVAAAHITPPARHVDGDSHMYQAVASEAVASVAAALGLPLHTRPSRGVAVASPQVLGYVPTDGDEVEDLVALLADAAAAAAAEERGGGGPLAGVVVGALWSDYQRLRVESAAARAGLLVLAPLWRAEQGRLLRQMGAYGLAPVVVKVGAMGLRVADVGAPLMGLLDRLDRLSEQYGVHVAGEGGEYESLVLDAPAFASRLRLARTEVAVEREDKWAPTARLLIHAVDLVAKEGGGGGLPTLPPEPAAFGGGGGEDLAQAAAAAAADAHAWERADAERWAATTADAATSNTSAARSPSGALADRAATGAPLPAVATHLATSPCGGYAHVSVTATVPPPGGDDAAAAAATTATTAAAAAAMAAATAATTAALAAAGWSPTDAVAVFVALPTCAPAAYAAANAVYAAAWPPAVVNPPPTRAAVAVGGPPPGPPGADADAMAVPAVTVEVALCRDRGTAGLHVQSLSPWAPPCIGPYAQAVMPAGEGVAYLSGALALRQLHIPPALTAAGCAAEVAAESGAAGAAAPTASSDDAEDTAAVLAAARQTRATVWNVGATLQAVPGASLATALFVAVFVARPADAAAAVAAVTRRLGAPAEADADLHWPPVAAADGVGPPLADGGGGGGGGGPVVSAVPAAGLPRDAAVEVVVVAGVPTDAPADRRPPPTAASTGGGAAAGRDWGTATWQWATRGGALTWLALRLRLPDGGVTGRGVTAPVLAAAVDAAVASLGGGRVLLSARVWTVATAAAARALGSAANSGGGGGDGGAGRPGGEAVWTVHPSAWVPHGDAAVVHAVVVAPAGG